MADNRIQKIVVVGGGTAGWMVASSMARFMDKEFCEVHLVESEDIPPVGVGEATIPQMAVFNRTLGIDETEFIKKTQATFKLGIEFEDWGALGESYMHGFGDFGRNMEALFFHHYWVKYYHQGKESDFWNYALSSLASRENRFMLPVNAGDSPLSHVTYAYQFDAGLFALFLREYSENRGVKRTQGKIDQTNLRLSDGFIESVTLEDGQTIEGDFFIDCSGFRGLLIEKAMGVGYQSWKEWLPCDRAWALPCERRDALTPYTSSIARSAGWQWRIPLQHRVGNGHVFSSDYLSEQQALDELTQSLEGEPLAEPKLLKFDTGKRDNFWHKNCVAIGLSSGFIEPLESTGIHLIQTSIGKLMSFFPDKDFAQANIDYFNRTTHQDYDTIRDFIILHYHATRRTDSEFWNYVRTMNIPETLQQRLDLFKANGHVHRESYELFNEVSWVEVMLGQGIIPKSYHPLVDTMPEAELDKRMSHIKRVMRSSVEQMPSHEAFIKEHFRAEKSDLYR